MSKANSLNRLSRDEKIKIYHIYDPCLNGEEFKDIVVDGVKTHYSVSNYGRVKNTNNGKILIPGQNTGGYLNVNICDYVNGIDKHIPIHRLVANVFIPHIDGCDVVNHKDGNILDCSVDNLEWTTYKGNSRHAVEHKLYKLGEDHPKAKMSDKLIHKICRDLEEGMSIKDLHKKYKIAEGTLRAIRSQRTRKDITTEYNTFTSIPEYAHGESHYKAKVSDDTVRKICQDFEDGMSVIKVAKKYGVSADICEQIKEGNTHREISKGYDIDNSKPDKYKKFDDDIFFEVVDRLKRGETNIEVANAMADKGITRHYVENVRAKRIRTSDLEGIEFPKVYKGATPPDVLARVAELLMQGLSNKEVSAEITDWDMRPATVNAIRYHRIYQDQFKDYDFPPTEKYQSPRGQRPSQDRIIEKRMQKARERIAKGGPLVIKLEGVRRHGMIF